LALVVSTLACSGPQVEAKDKEPATVADKSPAPPDATPNAAPAHVLAGEALLAQMPAPAPDAPSLARALLCEERESGWGCVGPDGAVVIPFEHFELGPFSAAGIAPAFHKDKGLWYVDATGAYLYESYNYDNGFDPISEGRSRFRFQGKIGFLDAEHRVVIPPRYDAAYYFDEGSAKVCVGCDPQVWSHDGGMGLSEGQVLYVDPQGQETTEKPSYRK
jgi:hypothetical protein